MKILKNWCHTFPSITTSEWLRDFLPMCTCFPKHSVGILETAFQELAGHSYWEKCGRLGNGRDFIPGPRGVVDKNLWWGPWDQSPDQHVHLCDCLSMYRAGLRDYPGKQNLKGLSGRAFQGSSGALWYSVSLFDLWLLLYQQRGYFCERCQSFL